MKSHLANVLDVYGGIFEDAYRIWPNDIEFLGKDLSYLRRASEDRGLSYFTITLPAFGKAFDRALSNGEFLASEVPQGIPMIQKRPKLFGTLYKNIFADDGMLKQHPCVQSVAYFRQLCFMAKKLRVQCAPHYVKETLDEFFKIEDRMLPPHADTWDSDAPMWGERRGHPIYGVPGLPCTQQLSFLDAQPTRLFPWDSLRHLCRRVFSQVGTPDWWSILPKHGPGATAEKLGKEFVSKYEFPNWPKRLDNWFPYDWFGSGSFDAPVPDSDREVPSRLIAVPKTHTGPRLICAEPVAHQWMQQGIRGWLEERIDRTVLGRSVSLRNQEYSREGALRASIDGHSCTIDLSAASDRLSCRLVEYVFQGSEVLDGIHACRTKLLSQTLSAEHPRVLKLKKFSTMGSALTFPVQSIVFAILTVYALRVAEGREDDWSNWEADFDRVRVYGDDIIAPTHAYSAITSLLSECGLKVNNAKSYSEGFFRESCGMDAFMGVDVTPARLLETYDGSATSMAATVETSNNFHKRGYWATAQVVANQLSPQELKLLEVVGDEVGGLGLYSFQGGSRAHLKRRWNPYLHRDEYTALKVTAVVTKARGTGYADLTQYFTEDPSPLVHWEAGQVQRVRTRKVRARVGH